MALLSRITGVWQNVCLRFVLMDNSSTTGGALTTLTPASTGLRISTIADNAAGGTPYTGAAIQTIASPGTYVAPAAASCRFGSVDQTNHPGLYELQLLNSVLTPANANYLVVTVQAPGSNCSPQSFLIDLSAQVDIEAAGDQLITAAGGIMAVNAVQLGGDSQSVVKLLLELQGRTVGTVTSATFNPTLTQFECSDITDPDATPVYANRGVLVTTSTNVLKRVAVVLTDIVGTSGRRFTTTAMPVVLASGDKIIIM
jgi:hypothetical protein